MPSVYFPNISKATVTVLLPLLFPRERANKYSASGRTNVLMRAMATEDFYFCRKSDGFQCIFFRLKFFHIVRQLQACLTLGIPGLSSFVSSLADPHFNKVVYLPACYIIFDIVFVVFILDLILADFVCTFISRLVKV